MNADPAVAPMLGFSQREPRGRIVCGDCLAEMRKLESGSFGIAITSPPYNLLNSTGAGNQSCNGYGDFKQKQRKWHRKGFARSGRDFAARDSYDCHDDSMPIPQYIEWQRDCVAEVMRLLAPEGVLFYNHKPRMQGRRFQRLADEITAPFPLRQIIIWSRPGGFNIVPTGLLHTYEQIYVMPKSDEWNPANAATRMANVWSFAPARNNPHPVPFPVELPRRCLAVAADTPGAVLDPFMGSGTTAIAAEQAGREWLGMEISEAYAAHARDRIAAEVATLPNPLPLD